MILDCLWLQEQGVLRSGQLQGEELQSCHVTNQGSQDADSAAQIVEKMHPLLHQKSVRRTAGRKPLLSQCQPLIQQRPQSRLLRKDFVATKSIKMSFTVDYLK